MPAGVSAWTPLANITLGSAQATVTFSSISNLYTDLVFIVGNIKSSATTNQIQVRFNGDTATNYYFVNGYGNGSSASTASSGAVNAFNPSSNVLPDTANPGQFIMHLMNYTNTSNVKTLIVRGDFNSTTFAGTGFTVGQWSNNSAVTQVQFFLQSAATFSAGTTFALYGVS